MNLFESFFTQNEKIRNQTVYDWAQIHLLPLDGKELERKSSELLDVFLHHPQVSLVANLINPEIYWAGGKTLTHTCMNYAMKELLMNLIVYGKCDYIVIEPNTLSNQDTTTLEGAATKDNTESSNSKNLPAHTLRITWDFENKAQRFIYKDVRKDKKENKTLKSGFTQSQKDIIWSALAVGYLEVENGKKKKSEIRVDDADEPKLNDKKKKTISNKASSDTQSQKKAQIDDTKKKVKRVVKKSSSN